MKTQEFRLRILPLALATAYSNTSKIFNLSPNNIDPTIITCIQLQNSRLVKFRTANKSLITDKNLIETGVRNSLIFLFFF